jgi:hypothetical protein
MAGVDALVRRLFGPAAALLLAVPAALALAVTERWKMWFGIPTPDVGLVPNGAALVAYGVAFGAGWLLRRQPDLLRRIEGARWLNLGLAAAATGACSWIAGLTASMDPMEDGALKLAYAPAYAVAGWAWTLALLGLALRFLSGYSAPRRYLSEASYWIYLVHLPLVMGLQVFASVLGAPWWIEYPLLLAVAMALMLASYQWLVRHGRIGRWLGGKRAPEHAPATRVAHVPG